MRRLAPLLLLLAFAGLLGIGLMNRPGPSSSRLIGAALPALKVFTLEGEPAAFPPASVRGRAYVLNVFASWCEPCAVEHPMLLRLSKTDNIPVIGLAWKDTPENVRAWLAARGNPYRSLGMDTSGKTTLPLALSGVPETFVIGGDGKVLYNRKAPLTEFMIENEILPLFLR